MAHQRSTPSAAHLLCRSLQEAETPQLKPALELRIETYPAPLLLAAAAQCNVMWLSDLRATPQARRRRRLGPEQKY